MSVDYETILDTFYCLYKNVFYTGGHQKLFEQLLEFTYYGEHKVSFELFESLVKDGAIKLRPEDITTFNSLRNKFC